MRGNPTTHLPGIQDVRLQIADLQQDAETFLSEGNDCSFRKISKLLGLCESTAHLIRSYLEYEKKIPDENIVSSELQIPPSPIQVSYENDTLRVFTPLTFSRGIPDSYILANSIRTELHKYQERNNEQLFWKLKPPLTVIMLRRARKYSSRLRDNDNMETGRIINVIFPELGLSDNCMLVPDIHSGFRLISTLEEEGMEFIVFSQKDAKKHFNELFAANTEEECGYYR